MRGERVAPGLPVCREVVVQRAGAGEGGVAGAGDEDREARGSRHPGPGTEADLSLSTWGSHSVSISYHIGFISLDLLKVVSTTQDIYTWR